jgi:hypothetical protein
MAIGGIGVNLSPFDLAVTISHFAFAVRAILRLVWGRQFV